MNIWASWKSVSPQLILAALMLRGETTSPQHVGRGGQEDSRAPGRCHGSNAFITHFFQVTDCLGSQFHPELSRMGRETERSFTNSNNKSITCQQMVFPAKTNSTLLFSCQLPLKSTSSVIWSGQCCEVDPEIFRRRIGRTCWLAEMQ